jgi:hypothetical protein
MLLTKPCLWGAGALVVLVWKKQKGKLGRVIVVEFARVRAARSSPREFDVRLY